MNKVMKAKVIKTGEIVEVYHAPQHGQVSNIYQETVLVNGRMWSEDELDFSINSKLKEVDLEKELDKWYNTEASKDFENVLYKDIEKCAKHFFELGLSVKEGE